MKTLFLLFASFAVAQSTFTNGIVPPTVTVAGLPTASTNTYRMFWVSDGASATDCTTGSGSTKVLCASNGTAWTSLGGGASDPATMSAGVGFKFIPYAPTFGTSSNTTAMGNATTVRWAEFWLDSPATFNTMLLQIIAGSGAACPGGGTCGMRVSIWDATRATMHVQSPAIVSGGSPNLNGGAGALLKVTCTLTTLPKGFYYLAYTTDSTALTLASVLSTGNTNIVGDPITFTTSGAFSALRMGTGANANTGNGATIAFPSSSGALTAVGDGRAVPEVILFYE